MESFLNSISLSYDSQLLEFIVRLKELKSTPEFCFQELRELIDEDKAKQIANFITKPEARLFSKAIDSVVQKHDQHITKISARDRKHEIRSKESTRDGDLRNLISKSRQSHHRLSQKAVIRQMKQNTETKKPLPAVDLSKPQALCKFLRDGCLNLDCQFYHPPGKEPNNVLKNITTVPFATGGNESGTNGKAIAPISREQSTAIWRFDPNCTRYGCYYKHPSKTSTKVYTSHRVFAVDQSEMMID